jgi:hypothetical protein
MCCAIPRIIHRRPPKAAEPPARAGRIPAGKLYSASSCWRFFYGCGNVPTFCEKGRKMETYLRLDDWESDSRYDLPGFETNPLVVFDEISPPNRCAYPRQAD